MSQHQMQLFIELLRPGLVSGFVLTFVWVAYYTKRAKWWRNQLGLSITVFAILVALLLVPSMLSVFFHLNRQDSLVAAWYDVSLIWLVTPLMVHRLWAWRRERAIEEVCPHCGEPLDGSRGVEN